MPQFHESKDALIEQPMKFDFEKIYEHIGYLLYGIASGNAKLSPGDVAVLTAFVEKNWKPAPGADQDLYSHLEDCIHQGIKYAVTNAMAPAHALESFRNYFIIHAPAFGETLRQKILSSASAILREFPGSSNGELMESDLQRLIGSKTVTV